MSLAGPATALARESAPKGRRRGNGAAEWRIGRRPAAA